jgi:hypothetical protein
MAVQSKIRCSTRDIKTASLTFAAQATQGDWVHQDNFVGMLVNTCASLVATVAYSARRVLAPCSAAAATVGDALYFHTTDAKMVLSAANVIGPVATLLKTKGTATECEVDLFGDYGRRAPLRTLTTGLIEA